MKFSHPDTGKPVCICDFCGMSNLHPEGPDMTQSRDAVICEPCARLAVEIFRCGAKSTPATTEACND